MTAVALALAWVWPGASHALAAPVSAPGWEASAHSYPTDMTPASKATVAVVVYNVGSSPSTGMANVTDSLPEGVSGVSGKGWTCSGAPSTCSYELTTTVAGGEGEELPLEVQVNAGAAEGEFSNVVSVHGGGASQSVSAPSTLHIAARAAGFGFSDPNSWFANADGTLDQQAGSHPYSLTVGFWMNANSEGEPTDSENAREVTVNMPPGLIGDQRAVPRCPRVDFDAEECPASTQVGVVHLALALGTPPARLDVTLPIYNLTPPPGSPAEMGFDVFDLIHAFFDASIRSASDYGLTVRVNDLPQSPQISLLGGEFTVWGAPAQRSHDAQRCSKVEESAQCGLSSGVPDLPFLTLPTSCEGPLSFSIAGASWRHPDVTVSTNFRSLDAAGSPTGISGCEHLGFSPSIRITPDTSSADTPAGLSTELEEPEAGLLDPRGLADASIRQAIITLPQGVAVNPDQAANLGACQFSEDGIGSESPPRCPPTSRVGTIEVEAPIFEDRLTGSAYLLQSSPPNLQLLLYVVGDGVELKLIAKVHLHAATGQVTTTIEGVPQAPISQFRLDFSGGPQSALVTPPNCGDYTTTSNFMPWSTATTQDAQPSSSFAITSGTSGAPCPPTPLPFTPTMLAGSTNDQAGAFSDFALDLSRPDDQQRMSGFQFKLPPGLLGMVGTVPLCPEPQASTGECPPSSQIGEGISQAGPGPFPLLVPEPGHGEVAIYLTGPYHGAPYGISVAVPAIAGPFNLGTVVIRGAVTVDPHTAAVTVTVWPLPSMLDGVPPDLRTISSVIDRPGFLFNPTNCQPMAIPGTISSTQGNTAPVESRFQVGSCRSLPFHPQMKVTTSGRASRTDGTSLDVKLTYQPAPANSDLASSQANVARVKVSLPTQLPARLSTVQKACPAGVFATNPNSCPVASRIGGARVSTPVLAGEPTGPVYFVSNGGAKFPELVVILQTSGGIRIDLHGETFISRTGLTSATFPSIPDAPITSFELYMPQGRYSALAANGNLCQATLKLPTEFVAQDGATIHQSTPIKVTGCNKTAPATRARKARHATVAKPARQLADAASATSSGPASEPGPQEAPNPLVIPPSLPLVENPALNFPTEEEAINPRTKAKTKVNQKAKAKRKRTKPKAKRR